MNRNEMKTAIRKLWSQNPDLKPNYPQPFAGKGSKNTDLEAYLAKHARSSGRKFRQPPTPTPAPAMVNEFQKSPKTPIRTPKRPASTDMKTKPFINPLLLSGTKVKSEEMTKIKHQLVGARAAYQKCKSERAECQLKMDDCKSNRTKQYKQLQSRVEELRETETKHLAEIQRLTKSRQLDPMAKLWTANDDYDAFGFNIQEAATLVVVYMFNRAIIDAWDDESSDLPSDLRVPTHWTPDQIQSFLAHCEMYRLTEFPAEGHGWVSNSEALIKKEKWFNQLLQDHDAAYTNMAREDWKALFSSQEWDWVIDQLMLAQIAQPE